MYYRAGFSPRGPGLLKRCSHRLRVNGGVDTCCPAAGGSSLLVEDQRGCLNSDRRPSTLDVSTLLLYGHAVYRGTLAAYEVGSSPSTRNLVLEIGCFLQSRGKIYTTILVFSGDCVPVATIGQLYCWT